MNYLKTKVIFYSADKANLSYIEDLVKKVINDTDADFMPRQIDVLELALNEEEKWNSCFIDSISGIKKNSKFGWELELVQIQREPPRLDVWDKIIKAKELEVIYDCEVVE